MKLKILNSTEHFVKVPMHDRQTGAVKGFQEVPRLNVRLCPSDELNPQSARMAVTVEIANPTEKDVLHYRSGKVIDSGDLKTFVPAATLPKREKPAPRKKKGSKTPEAEKK